MLIMRVHDRAHEFRIVVQGNLAGDSVRKVADTWASALSEALPRRIVVDISHVTECDAEGRKLLRDMHKHGTDLAAKTTASLAFLADATAPRRPNVSVLPARGPARAAALKAVAGR
ncbi:MAG TPA: hypothetical protein VH351_17805 [Bryobacteraceae bacterium]|jgi:hypothetical protein|nr:hypothetical protein [Bryobacteraceae bacterium]